MPAFRLKEDAKDLDFLLRLTVHLVDSCEEWSEFIPAHQCNRRPSKQVAKREKFAQGFDKVRGDHSRPGAGLCGHLGQ